MLRRNSATSRHRGRVRTVAVVVCVGSLVAASACRRPPTGGGGTSGATLDTVNYVNIANTELAAGRTPWFCKSQGLGGSMDHGHEGGLANDVYKGKVKGTLTPDQCRTNAQLFQNTINRVKAYKTRGDAKRAGSAQLVQHVDGLGTHDSVRGVTTVGPVTGPPMFLQYAGEGDNAPLAGLSWFEINGSPTPPSGFAGDNDWWHSHSTLCYSAAGKVVGNEISDAECTKREGRNLRLPGVWMAHAWIIPGWENLQDVFSGAYMCVKANGIPPAANDPCRTDTSNPEHGHATTTGGPTTRSTGPTTRSTGPTTRPATPTTRTPTTRATTTTMDMNHGDHGH
jgi:hypothetical protein